MDAAAVPWQEPTCGIVAVRWRPSATDCGGGHDRPSREGARGPPRSRRDERRRYNAANRHQTEDRTPKLHKVILFNDDFTPREFVVMVLKAEFRLNADQARRVMITAHQRGACVVAVFTKDIAETRATRATDAGRRMGYPLLFGTEPEE